VNRRLTEDIYADCVAIEEDGDEIFTPMPKFCIMIGRDGKPNYLHVRIHPDRPFKD
jgi:hypothetical protein